MSGSGFTRSLTGNLRTSLHSRVRLRIRNMRQRLFMNATRLGGGLSRVTALLRRLRMICPCAYFGSLLSVSLILVLRLMFLAATTLPSSNRLDSSGGMILDTLIFPPTRGSLPHLLIHLVSAHVFYIHLHSHYFLKCRNGSTSPLCKYRRVHTYLRRAKPEID